MATSTQQKVNFGSLDRNRTRQPPKRSKSYRQKQPLIPNLKKSGSLENVCTGTLVKEVPDDFLVHFDPKNVSGQMMDIDGLLGMNGTNSTLIRKIEGQVTPSRQAKRRMSTKKNNVVSISPDRETNEATDSGEDKLEKVEQVTNSSISISLQGEDGTITKSLPDLPISNGVYIGAVKSSVLRDSAISNDSGIGNDIPITHGVSTENSPTDLGTSDRLTDLGTSDRLLPPVVSSVKSRLAECHLKERPDSMLSQLCVMTVVLPALIHEGQKGKGAILKFRFSPHTLIETLRVAILKVCVYNNNIIITLFCMCMCVYCNA